MRRIDADIGERLASKRVEAGKIRTVPDLDQTCQSFLLDPQFCCADPLRPRFVPGRDQQTEQYPAPSVRHSTPKLRNKASPPNESKYCGEDGRKG